MKIAPNAASQKWKSHTGVMNMIRRAILKSVQNVANRVLLFVMIVLIVGCLR